MGDKLDSLLPTLKTTLQITIVKRVGGEETELCKAS
jgi:hypothetical protein